MIAKLNDNGREFLNNLVAQFNINDGAEITDDTLEDVLTQLLNVLDEGFRVDERNRVRRIYYRLFENQIDDTPKFNTPWEREGR